MNLCDTLIKTDIASYCGGITKGADSEGVMLNRSEIDFDASELNDDGSIKSIVLKSGAKGNKVMQPGNQPWNGTQTSMNDGTYLNTFVHDVSLVVLANDATVSNDIIDKIANGEFVVVLKKKNEGTDKDKANGRYQVYGWDSGLRASAATSELYSDDTNGGWAVTLHEEGALKSARFLVGDTKQATTAAYEALTAAAQ